MGGMELKESVKLLWVEEKKFLRRVPGLTILMGREVPALIFSSGLAGLGGYIVTTGRH